MPVPDLFFTYMSHRYPRLVCNSARAAFVNSMHGVRLREGLPADAKAALPLLVLNAVTMLGAEIHGRSYGGGILKMEPSEAAMLPVPGPEALVAAWRRLKPDRARLERKLQQGLWVDVAKRVDEALLAAACGVPARDVARLYAAAKELRRGRIGRDTHADGTNAWTLSRRPLPTPGRVRSWRSGAIRNSVGRSSPPSSRTPVSPSSTRSEERGSS
ncbi:MAG: adenine-specific DNA-methyltransferase [Solirubrobacteraceae bacterium]|nr:adenine-specific DNA-methyltransferase [Solirubrobacteraceae bacterium]